MRICFTNKNELTSSESEALRFFGTRNLGHSLVNRSLLCSLKANSHRTDKRQQTGGPLDLAFYEK